MEPLKPCKCGNEYPTLRIVDCASGSKLYQVYCKDCKKSASVSTSREEAETYWNKDMARNDLKPCPFCGKNPKIYRDISSEMSGHGAWCIVQCKPMFRKPHLKIEEGKALWERAFEYAVKEWNRRADNTDKS